MCALTSFLLPVHYHYWKVKIPLLECLHYHYLKVMIVWLKPVMIVWLKPTERSGAYLLSGPPNMSHTITSTLSLGKQWKWRREKMQTLFQIILQIWEVCSCKKLPSGGRLYAPKCVTPFVSAWSHRSIISISFHDIWHHHHHHHHQTADVLIVLMLHMVLMRWCCWYADTLILLMCWYCWCAHAANTADALMPW